MMIRCVFELSMLRVATGEVGKIPMFGSLVTLL